MMKTMKANEISPELESWLRRAKSEELTVVTGEEESGKALGIVLPLIEGKSGGSDLLMQFALKLYEEGVLSTGKAARLAGCGIAGFLEEMGRAGIPAVRYDPEDLEEELQLLEELEAP